MSIQIYAFVIWKGNRDVQNANAAELPEGAKARRVYLSLRDQITEGRLNRGVMLPGEQRLAESFGVSRVTVRRALDADEWLRFYGTCRALAVMREASRSS